MSVALSKKENKRQLREGDRIADFTVVKVLGHGGYGDIYLVKSRIHPDYLTRFAMKVEYPNKDNNNTHTNAVPLKNTKNDQNNNDEKGDDEKNSINNNDNDNKNNGTNDNNNSSNNNNNNNNSINNNSNNNNNSMSNKNEDQKNNDNKEYNVNQDNKKNEKNNNKNKNRGPLRKSHLYIERNVLNAIQDSPYFPRYISFGQTSLFRFLVMECFGPSLSTIRHVLPTGKYSLSSTLRIGIQMLRAIHSFHSHGFVHRDIKPSNFLIAASLSHPIILIDYGLARRPPTEKDRIPLNNSNSTLSNSNSNLSTAPSESLLNSQANLNQNTKGKFGFAGTTKYASINAHENKELGRRDDLFSWFYSLIELGAGSLPWSSNREKDDIYQVKKNADLDQFISKHSLPNQLCSIRILLESYSKTDEPDYDLIESFLQEAMRQNGSTWEDKYEWQRIDEESLSELSSIPLKPPKGDRYIPKRHLPEPILPSSKKSRRHKDHADEDYVSADINSIASKTKQRRHTSALKSENQSKVNRTLSYLTPDQNPNTNLQHYTTQVDNQGRYSYFSSADEKERYSHFGSDQLFSNSSGKLPPIHISSANKKYSASPIALSARSNNNNNNNINNNNNNATIKDEKNSTSNNKQKKYVTTIKRHKTQRKRRNSDPRQPPSIKKANPSKDPLNLDQETDNKDNSNESNDQKDNDIDQGLSVNGKIYRTLSNSNSIIFISHGNNKNNNDNDDNDNNNNDNDDNQINDDYTNSVYYTYHSYSSGDDIVDNNANGRNSRDNSYYYNNTSNYYDSDSGEFSIGEKQNNRYGSSERRKNPSCPAMEPKIDRNPNGNTNGKKNQKNCLIQ